MEPDHHTTSLALELKTMLQKKGDRDVDELVQILKEVTSKTKYKDLVI